LSKLSPTLDEKLERLDCEPANTSTLANVTDEDKLDSALSSSRRERLLRAGFLPPHADHIATDNTKVTFSKGAMLQTALTENMNQRQLIIYPAETSRPSRSTEQPRRPRFLAPIKGIYSHSGVAYAEIRSADHPLYEYTTDEHPLHPAGYYPGDWEITSENPPRWRYTGTLTVFHDEEDD